jgi:hypothetical protein
MAAILGRQTPFCPTFEELDQFATSNNPTRAVFAFWDMTGFGQFRHIDNIQALESWKVKPPSCELATGTANSAAAEGGGRTVCSACSVLLRNDEPFSQSTANEAVNESISTDGITVKATQRLKFLGEEICAQ